MENLQKFCGSYNKTKSFEIDEKSKTSQNFTEVFFMAMKL